MSATLQVFLVVLAGLIGASQKRVEQGQVSSAPPTFEVASIKATPPTGSLPSFQMKGERFVTTGFPLRYVIAQAYGLPLIAVEGPEWIKTRKFDIEAKIPAEHAGTRRIAEMLQALLKDRFAMQARLETQARNVFALVRSRADGALGPGLKRVQRDCSRIDRADSINRCSLQMGLTSWVAFGQEWSEILLTQALLSQLGERVVDKTGLSGQFDMELRWSADLTLAGGDVATDTPGSLGTALREQLGLKVERSREPVQVLVIDQISLPTPN
jgi:uncharacterized protein (TIGR03435 family)